MVDLQAIEDTIRQLCEEKTLESWYKLFDLDKILVKETWSSDLLHAHQAERLVVMVTNCCIDIAQNHLNDEESKEITVFTQDKIDRGEL